MNTLEMKEIPEILTTAKWIWPDSPNWDLQNCYALFRKNFELSEIPETAPLHITADQSYQLYINGKYVCRGPARGFQANWPFDSIDIAEYLQMGENLIAIRAYTPGVSNFQYIHQGFAGLLFAASLGQQTLVSDKTWKCRRQTGVRREMVPTSFQLFPQESVDLREESPDWMLPEFKDSHWNSDITALVWNHAPWMHLAERGIPMLREEVIEPGKVIGTAKGTNDPVFQVSRNLTEVHFNEGLTHEKTAIETNAIEFESSGDGHWRSKLIDFGKTYVGSTLLEIEDANGGEIVEAHYFETIEESTLCPDFDPEAHSRMAFSNRLTCREGDNRYQFYQTFGFRYMILMVRNSERELTIRQRLRTTLYPHEISGQFESSDTLLNSIWETCSWTEQVCSLDAYVDTPYREQAQWWGDARVQAWNTFHLSGDTQLFKRGIDQIATQTTEDGVTYGHAPTMAHKCILPDFTLIWMLTLWDYYWQTESLAPFLQHQKTIHNALAYFEEWTDSRTGLLRYDPRYWLFLDWTKLQKSGCSSVYNLWYLHALNRLEQLYLLSGDEDLASQCRSKSVRLREALTRLINSDGLMRDGCSEDGEISAETSVHAQTLALITGLCPQNEEIMLKRIILPYIRKESNFPTQPSAYWITYVYSLLSERGYGAEILADIRQRWAPMVEHGTTWETFSPERAHQSFSHAWSAHPLFHSMQILGGVRQSSPNWKTVSIEPSFIGDSARVTIPSPQGKIHSSWIRNGDKIEGKIALPDSVEATLILHNQRQTIKGGQFVYETES
tara:strand:- start:2675 stop:5026 length:2352 start_codon:yes stop_codon:yes gene_type:complete